MLITRITEHFEDVDCGTVNSGKVCSIFSRFCLFQIFGSYTLLLPPSAMKLTSSCTFVIGDTILSAWALAAAT